MNTTMTNYGYLIKKTEITTEMLEMIKTDLMVSPLIKNNAYNKNIEKFKIYEEGTLKILLPKYYGIEKFGYPTILQLKIASIDRIDLYFKGIMRDYQMDIIQLCKKIFMTDDCPAQMKPFGGGVISIRAGGGKTVIALYLIHLFKLKCLVIVHKNNLIGQWIERIQQYLPNARIGTLMRDKINIENKDIVIGMLQSICLRNYDDDIFEGFPFVIFDEVHHLGAKVFSQALLKIQAPYTLGLSATPERADKLEKVFYWHLGNILNKIEKEKDKTVNIRIYNYTLSKSNPLFKMIINPRMKQVNMVQMTTNLVELDIRNDFIIKLLLEIFPIIPIDMMKVNKQLFELPYLNQYNMFDKRYHSLIQNLHLLSTDINFMPRKILILSHRVIHLTKIKNKMLEINSNWDSLIDFYIGGMKDHQYKIAATKPIILATYDMASEALDIKELDTLMFATPKGDVTQSIGRILRLLPEHRKNTATIYDIVDNIPIFVNRGKKRYAEYMACHYNINWYNACDTMSIKRDIPLYNVPSNHHSDLFLDNI